MTIRSTLAMALLMITATQIAIADDSATPFRRWGVGWDDGIAARYRLNETWGVGLRIDPSLTDETSDSKDESVYEGETERSSEENWMSEGDRQAITVGTMIYRETRIGRWVGLGPFAAVNYSWSDDDDVRSFSALSEGETYSDPERHRTDVDIRKSHTVDFLLGIRPAFHIENRFVLETRFGLRLRYYSNEWNASDVSQSIDEGGDLTTGENTTRSESSRWSFDSFGHDLGLGATMQFILYL